MTQTHYDLLVSLISVYKAMGGGWVTEADKLDEPKKNECADPQLASKFYHKKTLAWN